MQRIGAVFACAGAFASLLPLLLLRDTGDAILAQNASFGAVAFLAFSVLVIVAGTIIRLGGERSPAYTDDRRRYLGAEAKYFASFIRKCYGRSDRSWLRDLRAGIESAISENSKRWQSIEAFSLAIAVAAIAALCDEGLFAVLIILSVGLVIRVARIFITDFGRGSAMREIILLIDNILENYIE